jgi:hypothetical protein
MKTEARQGVLWREPRLHGGHSGPHVGTLLKHTVKARGEGDPNQAPRLYIDIPGAGNGCEYFVSRLGAAAGKANGG